MSESVPLFDLRSCDDAEPQPIRAGEGGFFLGDGVAAAAELEDLSVDLLLTDPPYAISSPYTCESQIPKRPRSGGGQFVMPKGDFGGWDQVADPTGWADTVLPKIGGWAVFFCAHAQIGDYCQILADHGFVAVQPMVWHKTNPVPFNHRNKPISAWEAVISGKRPGTKFNGASVHNVFMCPSPSPAERIHPTQKPLRLISDMIGLFSSPGNLVFDPFAGSGSTVAAAREHGRVFLAYEQDEAIYAQATRRLNRCHITRNDER